MTIPLRRSAGLKVLGRGSLGSARVDRVTSVGWLSNVGYASHHRATTDP